MATIQSINVSNPNDGNGDTLRDSQIKANENFSELNDKKVEKVSGKDLSENDFSDTYKTKLDGIEEGAQVNVIPNFLQDDDTAADYILNRPDAFFNSIGSFHYADLATQTTPIATVANTPIKVTNDGAGAFTNLSNAPYGVDTVWVSTTNQFDFSSLSIGDCVSLRTDLNIDLVGTNTSYRLFMKMAIGSGNEWELNLHNGERKSTTAFPETTYIGFDIENEDTRDFPAEIWIETDAGSAIKVNGWFLKIVRANINVVKVKESYIHDFTSLENQQTFVIPNNYTLGAVFLNRTFLIQSEYTFSGGILTILETLETGTIISTR